MDQRVFKLFREIMNGLDDKQRDAFREGFSLGISEGIAQCTKKIKVKVK